MSKVYVRDVHSGFINADHIVAIHPDREMILISLPGGGPVRKIDVSRGGFGSGAEQREDKEMDDIALKLADAILTAYRNTNGSIIHWGAESESWAIH